MDDRGRAWEKKSWNWLPEEGAIERLQGPERELELSREQAEAIVRTKTPFDLLRVLEEMAATVPERFAVWLFDGKGGRAFKTSDGLVHPLTEP